MSDMNDTIAAIATAPGAAGIAIVRVSGPRSLEIADRIVRCSGPPPSRRAAGHFLYGHVRPPDAALDLDEVIVLIYRAPHSYTCEDVVEIQGHGGRTAAARILRAVLEAGGRPAEAGEFTRRAFLNGRIDLLQAEAVMDLIQAHSDRAAAAAVEQMKGALSTSLSKSYDEIIGAASDLEATLDFGEHDLPAAPFSELVRRLVAVLDDLKAILQTWNEGHRLREGARVVICGQANVGKSTLMNLLLETDRSIVTPIPGTTRDLIEEQVVLDGIPIRLIDTAGLRESDCLIEREGIERARGSIRLADVIIYVLDGSREWQPQDLEALSGFDPKRLLIVLNKIDLGDRIDRTPLRDYRHLACSLKNRDHLAPLRPMIVDILGVAAVNVPHAVISERHRVFIQQAVAAVGEAVQLLRGERDDSAVLAAHHVREALDALGLLTGRTYTQALLDSIFSRFCIGK